MRVPTRRYDQVRERPDPHITKAKFDELCTKLDRLKNITRPKQMAEVKRLAEMGDFSENHAYSVAKSRLRGTNQWILDIEDQLKRAIIIEAAADGRVELGSTVTVTAEGRTKTFLILGSTETDPFKGIISHNSPIGAALMHKRIGDKVKVKLANKEVEYLIVQIA